MIEVQPMTAQPPSPGSNRRDPLGFDELVALLVAFAAIGAVLWWSIGRRADDWLGQQFSPPSPEVATPGIAGSLGDGALSADEANDTANRRVDGTNGDSAVSPLPPDTVAGASGSVRRSDGVPNAALIPAIVAPAVIPSPAPATPVPSPTASAGAPSVVVPGVSPEAAIRFPDLPNSYWAYPFVAELTRRGIISGFQDGTFRPDQPVTRAEYAALIGGVLPAAQQAQIPFNDVPAGFWGTQAIDQAVKSGFLKGYPDATFEPTQPISKMQVLLSLANGFQLAKPANPGAVVQAFDDRAQIPEWATPAVAAAAESGVVVNYPNVSQLNPNQPATRGEVAAMLYQALTTTGQLSPIPSNYIARP